MWYHRKKPNVIDQSEFSAAYQCPIQRPNIHPIHVNLDHRVLVSFRFSLRLHNVIWGSLFGKQSVPSVPSVVKILYRYMLHFCDFLFQKCILRPQLAIFCNIGHIPGRIYSVIQDFSCRNLRFYKFLHVFHLPDCYKS